ncbi:hypothetical protein T05_8728 [Trichinella murrelli]|uniref:Uncharacterized protein n=1 Tax=Trichinella murrelli TaxID=144512 RepID=A0A0V0UFK5_9BILA|nr:hypothetical protein T05_8728 [Trichinella murrelli]
MDIRRRYPQLSADREVANQLSAVRKHRATGQHVWHPAHVVVSPPHQLPSLPPDLQSKEAGSVSGTLVGFARQPIVRQVPFTRSTATTLSFTRMSSMYAEVPFLTSGSRESTQFITAFMTNGATFRPNPRGVR